MLQSALILMHQLDHLLNSSFFYPALVEINLLLIVQLLAAPLYEHRFQISRDKPGEAGSQMPLVFVEVNTDTGKVKITKMKEGVGNSLDPPDQVFALILRITAYEERPLMVSCLKLSK